MPEQRSIHRLPADVAAKIAAGEVVERPASVVKELVENALDAGASAVRVELEGGGLDLIRVVDDGGGIAAEELPLAFERHATSKIATIDDLERIHTLGFRGEALASVAAVARVTLASRARGAAAGAQVTVDEGRMGPLVPSGAPAGTSVTVRGLFISVPARLKFLKTKATETGHALKIVEQYALAYPGVRFTATSEGREIFHTTGDGSLLNVIIAVHGLRVAEEMVPIGETALGEMGADVSARPRPSACQRLRQPPHLLQGDAAVPLILRQRALGAEPRAELCRRGGLPLAAAGRAASGRGRQHRARPVAAGCQRAPGQDRGQVPARAAGLRGGPASHPRGGN